MKVLVTGAAGDIGSHLVPALLDGGHHVRALVRTPSEAHRMTRLGVETWVGDVAVPQTLNGSALGADAVFHLAAVLFVANPEEDLRRVNYEGTINMANECIDKGVKRFIFPSFPLVLGPSTVPQGPISPEDATEQPNTFHALYKKLCEQHLLVLSEHGKLSPTILRLGTVYGPDIRLIRTLEYYMRRRLYRIPGNGDTVMSFAHVDDVVQAMLLALGSEKAEGQIYNVADDMPVKFKDFVFTLADLMRVSRPGFAPVWLYRNLASLAVWWAQVSRSTPLINDDILTFSLSSFWADTAKTKADLGFRPIYPTIYEGLPTCVDLPQGKRRKAAA